MKHISIDDLYNLYLDTAAKGSSHTKELTQEELEYYLFEEFDVGVYSFFHDENLQKLRRAGLISDHAVELSQSIRQRWITLQETSWTISDIKSAEVWNKLFDQCDQLLAELSAKM